MFSFNLKAVGTKFILTTSLLVFLTGCPMISALNKKNAEEETVETTDSAKAVKAVTGSTGSTTQVTPPPVAPAPTQDEDQELVDIIQEVGNDFPTNPDPTPQPPANPVVSNPPAPQPAPQPAPPVQYYSDAGFTDFSSWNHDNVYYVSDSTGSDTNDGLSTQKPLKTIAAGIAKLRNGYADWLLLKRGDTFLGNQADSNTSNKNLFGRWKKSGASSTRRLLIAYYGDMSLPRPIIRMRVRASGEQPNFEWGHSTQAPVISHVAVIGLHLAADIRTTGNGSVSAIKILSGGEDLLFEDLFVERAQVNVERYITPTQAIDNVVFRRCLIVDNYALSSHAQGIYATGVDNLKLVENIFDHNGWYEGIVGAEPTIYNHNVYINSDRGKEQHNFEATGNIFARSSAEGLLDRSGGIVDDNFFIKNPLALVHGLGTYGSSSATSTDPYFPGGVTGHIRRNVVYQSGSVSGGAIGEGMWIGNSKDVDVANNLIIHNAPADGFKGYAFRLAAYTFSNLSDYVGIQVLHIHDNVVYNWYSSDSSKATKVLSTPPTAVMNEFNSQNDFNQPASRYVSPAKSMKDYMTEQYGGSYASENAALTDFFAKLRQQRKGHYDVRLTSDSVNAFFQENFRVH